MSLCVQKNAELSYQKSSSYIVIASSYHCIYINQLVSYYDKIISQWHGQFNWLQLLEVTRYIVIDIIAVKSILFIIYIRFSFQLLHGVSQLASWLLHLNTHACRYYIAKMHSSLLDVASYSNTKQLQLHSQLYLPIHCYQ